MLLTTSLPPYCASNWHDWTIRLFRLGAAQTLLFDESAFVNLGWDPDEFRAEITPDGFLVAFRGVSLSPGFSRLHVWRYAFANGGMERREPFAFGAQDFVESG